MIQTFREAIGHYDGQRDRFLSSWIVTLVQRSLTDVGIDAPHPLVADAVHAGMERGAKEWRAANGMDGD